jgi:Tol biopolymer transport system component
MQPIGLQMDNVAEVQMWQNKRSGLVRLGIGVLSILCCVGFLGIRFVLRHFPMSTYSPKLRIEQPLGEGEAIAFSLMRVDMLRPFELYILDDAEGARSISQGLARSDIGPMWSPDGAWIVYVSVYGGSPRYYLVDTEGLNRREIAADDGLKYLPRWSPDGSRLAYLSYPPQSAGSVSDSFYLCVTNVATGHTDRLAAGNVHDYAWMPDGGSLLAIVREDDLITAEVYAVDGNNRRRLAQLDYLRDALTITLSPDASRVAYVVPADEKNLESLTDSLYISKLDGSARHLVGGAWMDGSVVWSPDSTKVAAVSLTDNAEYVLYVVNANGSDFRELMLLNTGDESGEILPAAPAWSPDGTRIAISSHISPDGAAIFVTNADGTEQRQITAIAGGMMYDLAWRPNE